jgi:outer membrane receptor for ferrienterochelin and colicins
MHPFVPALAVLAICTNAAAQAPAVTTVEVSARAGQADTASKTIITSAMIRRHGDTSMLDVLKRVPGITVAGGLRMRGLGEGFVQILLNGEAAPAGFSIESLTPESIERIEVSRAPSAEHSARGIAGSINFVLRRTVAQGRRDVRTTLATQAQRPSAQVALNVAGRRGALSYVLAGGGSASRSALDASQSERVSGARAQATTTARRDLGRSGALDFSPRLSWQLGSDTVAWQSFLQFQRGGNDGQAASASAFGLRPQYDRALTHSTSGARVARSSVQWLRRLDDQASLDMSLTVSGALRDTDAHFAGDAPVPGLTMRQQVTRHTRDSGLTSKGKYSFPARGSHTAVLGWEGAANARAEERAQWRQSGQAAPVLTPGDSSVRVRRAAAFAQDEWEVGGGWSMYLGLRWEQVRTLSAGMDSDTQANRYAVWSPILQSLWKDPARPGTRLRMALARTYEAPMPQTLIARRILAPDNKASTPDYQGNARLRPTLAWGADLGLEHEVGNGVTLGANAYARRLSDVAARALLLQDGRWVAMVDNNGSASVHGFDLDARVTRDVGDARGGALRSVALRANLARNWSKVDRVDGPFNRLDGQVPVSAGVGVDVQLRALPVTLGADFGFQGGGMVANSNQERAWTSATRTLDVYGAWSVGKHGKLRLSLSNVLAQPGEMVSTLVDGDEVHTQAMRSSNARSVRFGWEYGGW